MSIIIAAYNEAKDIERKMENTLNLDYPDEKMEILAGSDGSTDETPALLRKYVHRGIQFFNFEQNRGKTAVQNYLVGQCKGDILVFTDAASFLQRDALKMIVRNFSDDRVGGVAGLMRFRRTGTNITTQSQGLYWQYELKLRNLESRLGSLIGVDGPLYAVRKDCYVPLATNIMSDFITPLLVLTQGRKMVLETEAVVTEDAKIRASEEFATRRRITLRGLVALSAHRVLLNPLKHPIMASQIFFHKLLRWLVGPLLVLNILACWTLLTYGIFRAVLLLYMIFFLAGTAGWLAHRLGIGVRILTVPYYFTLVNLAATLGILDFLKKRQATTWKPTRG